MKVTHDIDRAVAELDRRAKTATEQLRDELRDLQQRALARLIAESPVKTGRLKGNWRARVSPGGRVFRIENRTWYARLINKGAYAASTETLVEQLADEQLSQIADEVANG